MKYDYLHNFNFNCFNNSTKIIDTILSPNKYFVKNQDKIKCIKKLKELKQWRNQTNTKYINNVKKKSVFQDSLQ